VAIAVAVAVVYTAKVYCPSCFASEVEKAVLDMVCLRDHLAIDSEEHIVGFVSVEVEAKAGHCVLRIVERWKAQLNFSLHQRLWAAQAVVQSPLLL
jgi:hypothetical protein